ncbi:hypothetical protein ACB092_04G018500 [Castanea dentata]
MEDAKKKHITKVLPGVSLLETLDSQRALAPLAIPLLISSKGRVRLFTLRYIWNL